MARQLDITGHEDLLTTDRDGRAAAELVTLATLQDRVPDGRIRTRDPNAAHRPPVSRSAP